MQKVLEAPDWQLRRNKRESSRYWRIKSDPVLYEKLLAQKRLAWAKRRDNGFKAVRPRIVDQYSHLQIPDSYKWKLRNPEKAKAINKSVYQKIKNDPIKYRRLREQMRNSQRRIKPWRKNREEVLYEMGGKCVRCNFSDFRALQIDHVNGDGASERRKMNFSCGANKNFILDGFRNGRYQLLCANCQWIKRHENNEHGTKNISEVSK